MKRLRGYFSTHMAQDVGLPGPRQAAERVETESNSARRVAEKLLIRATDAYIAAVSGQYERRVGAHPSLTVVWTWALAVGVITAQEHRVVMTACRLETVIRTETEWKPRLEDVVRIGERVNFIVGLLPERFGRLGEIPDPNVIPIRRAPTANR